MIGNAFLLPLIWLSIAKYYVQAQKVVIPAPNGTYTVGRSTLQMINKDSIQPFSPVLEAPALQLSVFYPTDSGNTTDVPYMPVEVAQISETMFSNVPGINFSRGIFERLAMQLAPDSSLVAQPATRWPLLVFSSALGVNRNSYNALVSEVASSGYVVITFDTPYSTNIVLYSNGSTVLGNLPAFSAANVTSFAASVIAEIDVRAQDISYILRQFSNSTFASSVIPGCCECLNTSHVGVFGHSLGGATAATVMLNDTQVAGALDYDGTLWGDVIQKGLSKPFMIMAKQGGHRDAFNTIPYNSWAQIWPRLTSSKFDVILNNSRHLSFSDYPLVFELLGLLSTNATILESVLLTAMNGTRAHHVVSTYTTAFFDWLLKDQTAELIAAPSPLFPEISLDTDTTSADNASRGTVGTEVVDPLVEIPSCTLDLDV